MRWILGIDEVGRGPLAGPVGVGIFAVPEGYDMQLLEGVRDSKKLSEAQREKWYSTLTSLPDVKFAVSMASAGHIDRHGIQHAIKSALAHALEKVALDPTMCTVLLDGGLKAPDVYGTQTTIIRGDSSEPCISASSIVAKVTRDRYMIAQADTFPLYGFETHKGYGTEAHRTALRTYGPCALHRATFCKNILRT
jgi:ribonuclease HII